VWDLGLRGGAKCLNIHRGSHLTLRPGQVRYTRLRYAPTDLQPLTDAFKKVQYFLHTVSKTARLILQAMDRPE
jgi:hypothetical protein